MYRILSEPAFPVAKPEKVPYRVQFMPDSQGEVRKQIKQTRELLNQSKALLKQSEKLVRQMQKIIDEAKKPDLK